MQNTLFVQFLSIRGRKKALADSIGVSKQTVSDWVRKGVVSSEHAAKVSAFTGIAKEVLCPGFDWGTDTVVLPPAGVDVKHQGNKRDRRVGPIDRRTGKPDRRVSERSVAERAARTKKD